MRRPGVEFMKVGLSLLVLLSMVACSRDPVSTEARPAGTQAARAAGGGADSVAAVAQGGSARAVALRFVRAHSVQVKR